MELNELLPGMDHVIAKTDSRLRPDQKAMEMGKFDIATSEKLRLEEKQREAKKEREKKKEVWRPRWFRQEKDDVTGEDCWVYVGGYWESRDEGKWENIADIF